MEKIGQLEVIDQKYCYSNYYNISVNIYGDKYGTSLRFYQNQNWINKTDPYGWFQWYSRYWLGRRFLDDERHIDRWKGIVSRFKGKSARMIRDVNGKFDDYSISPKIRQTLHWGYELPEKNFSINSTSYSIELSYYQLNRQEILQKAKDRFSKNKAVEYYFKNKEAIKEESKNPYKNLSKEEKVKIKEYQKKDISN